MAERHRHAIIVAGLSLLTGLIPGRVGAQEVTPSGLPAAGSPQGAYHLTLGAAASGGDASGDWSSSSPDAMEYGAPQL